MNWIISYLLPFLFVLTVLVFVHEFGHFYVARKVGVKVTTFSIGFGPKLISWLDSKGTLWCISLIPLGGYVKMLGDSDPSGTSTATEGLSEEEKKYTLASKKPWQKALVAFAGPFANYVLAFFFIFFIALFKGIVSFEPVVGTVKQNYPAQISGILPKDKIVSIDGIKVEKDIDVKSVLENAKETIEIKVLRGSEEILINTPMFEVDNKTGLKKQVKQLGITFKGEPFYEKSSFLKSVNEALNTCYVISYMTVQGIFDMIAGKSKGEIGGILTIGDMAGKSVSNGIIPCLWFMAILSINLGVINLFPLPVVDGGHILLAAVEGIRRKPLSEKLQEKVFLFGFVIVASLMIYSTWNDLKRYKVIDYITSIFSKDKQAL